MAKVRRKLTRKQKEEETILAGKVHKAKCYRQKKFERDGGKPLSEKPEKSVIKDAAKIRTFWKNPAGKVVVMDDVEGDFIDSSGITYDYESLVSAGWTKL